MQVARRNSIMSKNIPFANARPMTNKNFATIHEMGPTNSSNQYAVARAFQTHAIPNKSNNRRMIVTGEYMRNHTGNPRNPMQVNSPVETI